MKIAGYNEMMHGLERGEPESAKNAIKALCAVLKNAVNSQYLLPYQNDEFKAPMALADQLLASIEGGVLSIVPGSHTQVEDDDDTISQSSYEQHWQDNGKSFHDDVAKSIGEFKRLEDIANSLKEKNKIEKKATAFDEISGEIVGLYRAVNSVRACVNGDYEQYKVHLAMIDAMFSLGVIAQIITKTKEDVA